MDKGSSEDAWGIKICPIRNKQCLEGQCAWWMEEDKMCAVKKIKLPAQDR